MSTSRILSSGQGIPSRTVTSSGAASFYTSDGDSIIGADDEDESLHENHINPVRQRAESSTINDQIYMSIFWQGGRLGLAYYDIESTQIHMMMDSIEHDDFSLLQRVIRQINPVIVVLSSKQDDRLIKTLKPIVTVETDDETEDVLQFLPSIDFSADICKRRILNLDLPSLPKHYTESERTLYISSLVPFDNQCMIRATGGLLKYLEKMRVGIELEDTDVRVPILDIKTFTLEDQLLLDDIAFCALQIFHKELHPSVYKSGQTGAKEGLSLFGILNRCRSQIGSRQMRVWFLRPLRDQSVLKQRHDAVSFFITPRNIEIVSALSDNLNNVKDIQKVLSRMQQSQASIGDWQALYRTTYHAISIGDLCKSQSHSIDIFKKVSLKFGEELHRIANLISKIVDFDEMSVQNRFVVNPNVDEDLDEKKRRYNGLPDFMTQVAKEELNRLSEDITECNVIYLPQFNRAQCINPEAKLETVEVFDQEVLEQELYEQGEVYKLFHTSVDLSTDQETSIMHKLQNSILEHTKALLEVLELCGELDCLLAFATCAKEFNYVKPKLVPENVIDIKSGRHPLQELCCSPFVPNDVCSGQDYSNIKILTGPNACGKSVYLKQVAVIVYMAHIGSFVPAESASIGPIERIYTRIQSLDSVSVGLSTFMIDINQMSQALKRATESSLIIIDEFGKGTEMVDGMSLLCGCLTYWLEMGKRCPHVFVCTHFHSLINQHLLPKSPKIKYMTLETVHDGEELLFLYHLVAGHTNSSYASHIALQAGLPQEIVKRGTEVSKLIRQNKPIEKVDTEGTDTQYKRSKMIVDRFLELDLENGDLISFLSNVVLPISEGQI
ncbi:DNA mismatch repair protein MSH5 [Mytilus galloprovincialis]|uniref:MutS protein homolog 5 n=1 Tax=Mytilus galloprovincialis TaxID=29158 RepID=A0A8B6GKQ9_MYTGA|nr:DNA mismatch repair protein MSH5 [Mytilus galloprovincialis]